MQPLTRRQQEPLQQRRTQFPFWQVLVRGSKERQGKKESASLTAAEYRDGEPLVPVREVGSICHYCAAIVFEVLWVVALVAQMGG